MKIRIVIVAALLTCCMTFITTSCGSRVTSNEQKELISDIHSKNNPAQMKEMISRMKSELETDQDRFPDLIQEMEQAIKATSDPASKAVLHSMTAEMYQQYYRQDRWRINQRSDISGYVPEDIREWSSNLFTDTIRTHVIQSLEPAKLLQETPTNRFQEIMEAGKDAPALRPTLFDFLSQRAVNIQPTEEIYSSWLQFRRSQDNKKAALMVELSYLSYQYYQKRDEASKATCEKALDKLMREYASEDFSTEIRIMQLELLEQSQYRSSNADSVVTLQYRLITEGIRLYPNYEQINVLKNKLSDLENPRVSSQVTQKTYPNELLKVNLDYRNTPQVVIRIYESLRTPLDLTPYTSSTNENQIGRLIKEVSLDLPNKNTYSSQNTTLTIPFAEKPGIYECEVSTPQQTIKTKHTFVVTRLAALYRHSQTGNMEVLVTDLKSGKPIPQAKVTYYGNQRRNLEVLGTLSTDKNGLAVLPSGSKALAFQASVPGDESSHITTVYSRDGGDPENQSNVQVSLFTDRGLYRPGQTVYFKGIAYKLEREENRVAPNQTFTVTLRDANDKEIVTRKLTTNEFGSFNGEFILPKQTLSGYFSINADNYTTGFRVEEYKRPTFSVDIDPIREEVAFGDWITLQGKAKTFSGVALQTGDVEWQIVRRPFWLRIGIGRYSSEQVASGKTTISPEGTFSVAFRPEKTEEGYPQYYTYELAATVTDSKGESQPVHFNFAVGENRFILSSNLPDKVEKSTVKAVVSAQLLNGEGTSASGTFRIVELTGDEPYIETYNRAVRQMTFKEGKVISTGSFKTGEAMANSVFTSLPSGRYRIYMEATDSKGGKVENKQDFILFGKNDKRPPVFLHTWLITEKTECLPGESAEWSFGTSDKEAYVLYEVFGEKKLLRRERIILNNENRKFRFLFKEEYGDGVTATFTFVKEGHMYTSQVRILRKQPDRKLTLRPETFRDKLLPGNKETWQFRITDKDSLAVSAEVLASLYDMSLDKISPFSWYFSPERNIWIQASHFALGEGFSATYQYDAAQRKNLPVYMYQYDMFDWQDVFAFGRTYGDNMIYASVGEGGDIQMKSTAPAPRAQVEMTADDAVEEESLSQSQTNQSYDEGGGKADSPIIPSLRTNFNETAFFFPTLRTNEKGDLILNFTMPESNTTWKFQALAHTKDLKYGLTTQQVITSKPLMVLPNLPRFLRQGDRVTVSAQIMNQSEKEINGVAQIELFDPATGTPVVCLTKAGRPFSLAAGTQTATQWTISVPTDRELIGIRITADAEAGSDGEQHLLPILSNQILVTESTPFYMYNSGEQQVNVIRPKVGKPYRMTLEVSGNPVWYAVQALSTLTNPKSDNILDWFASYYTNTLATSIAASHPRIRQVIEAWTAQGGDAATLLSNLEKNEELKNILLEETPWVLEAENETERKQRLALLFDINRATNQREVAMQRILDQQLPDGSWGWFKGFYPSRGITLSILKGMTQLVQLSAAQYNQQEKEMQMNALRYLDRTMQEDFESLKKYNKDWEKAVPTAEQLEFLFVRSAYRDIPESGEAREAIRFYTNQAEKNWSKLSLYGKGQVALLMHRNGKKEIAGEILSWLRKTATVSEERGMFWANNRKGMDFFTSPVEVHTLLMLAFDELAPDTNENNRMKQWLLNEKRTQDWGTTPATTNAIHALLLTGADWLTDTNTVTIGWNGQTYSTLSGETGTGYLKQTVNEETVNPNSYNLTVKKEGNAPAWGAVYNQYFVPIDQIESQKGILNVEKKLFTETHNGAERKIEPITAGKLKVGDKVIVRLTVRTDRDMDYAYLKDHRAGCFEPTEQLSGYRYQDGVGFYRQPKDVSENFFFQHLPKGTFVLEYSVFVSRIGEYAEGISTIQCLYAPEFVSHTEGEKLLVE